MANLVLGAVTYGSNVWDLRGQSVKFVFQSPYRGVVGLAEFEAKRWALSKATEAIGNISQKAKRDAINKAISARDEVLIKDNQAVADKQEKQFDSYGFIETEGQPFQALDIMGRPVRTALILWCDSDMNHTYTLNIATNANDKTKSGVLETTKIIVCDLAPSIEQSSKKNVAITDVVGRDYSRKELIGNGDVTFRVSGKFVHENMDVYPADQVSCFIDIVRHGGIVNVNNFLFGQHNIKKIIITDYSLPQTDCLNEQPYSFNCIGVEPDEEVFAIDTISPVKVGENISAMEGWYQSTLSKYLEQAAKNAVVVGGNMLPKISDFL